MYILLYVRDDAGISLCLPKIAKSQHWEMLYVICSRVEATYRRTHGLVFQKAPLPRNG